MSTTKQLNWPQDRFLSIVASRVPNPVCYFFLPILFLFHITSHQKSYSAQSYRLKIDRLFITMSKGRRWWTLYMDLGLSSPSPPFTLFPCPFRSPIPYPLLHRPHPLLLRCIYNFPRELTPGQSNHSFARKFRNLSAVAFPVVLQQQSSRVCLAWEKYTEMQRCCHVIEYLKSS